MTISGTYDIGEHKIGYELSGIAAGADRGVSGTQTVDDKSVSIGFAFIDGRAFGRNASGNFEAVSGDPAQVRSFGKALYTFTHALVLEDLGRSGDQPEPTYRLRIVAGMALFPPQFGDGTIKVPRDQAQRLELTVNANGVPMQAVYTRSARGTIDGVDATARGTVTFTFTDVGAPLTVSLPPLEPGASLPPPLEELPAPDLSWQPYSLANGRYRVEIPGTPEVSEKTVDNASLGKLQVRTARILPAGAPRFSVIESALPADYVASMGAAGIATETGKIEAKALNAEILGSYRVDFRGVVGLEFVLGTPQAIYRFRNYVFEGGSTCDRSEHGPQLPKSARDCGRESSPRLPATTSTAA